MGLLDRVETELSADPPPEPDAIDGAFWASPPRRPARHGAAPARGRRRPQLGRAVGRAHPAGRGATQRRRRGGHVAGGGRLAGRPGRAAGQRAPLTGRLRPDPLQSLIISRHRLVIVRDLELAHVEDVLACTPTNAWSAPAAGRCRCPPRRRPSGAPSGRCIRCSVRRRTRDRRGRPGRSSSQHRNRVRSTSIGIGLNTWTCSGLQLKTVFGNTT